MPALGGLAGWCAPIVAAPAPPLARPDLPQLAALVATLRANAGGVPLYVAASSGTINGNVIANAERTWYAPDARALRVMEIPEVDSRDGSPLAALQRADAVLVV